MVNGSWTELYFKCRYSDRTPGIYYDRIYKVYVNSEMIKERGELYYVLCETVRDNLIYHYRIGSDVSHEHSFDSVMLHAYQSSAAFSVPEEYRGEYSEQELSLLHKIAAQSANT